VVWSCELIHHLRIEMTFVTHTLTNIGQRYTHLVELDISFEYIIVFKFHLGALFLSQAVINLFFFCGTFFTISSRCLLDNLKARELNSSRWITHTIVYFDLWHARRWLNLYTISGWWWDKTSFLSLRLCLGFRFGFLGWSGLLSCQKRVLSSRNDLLLGNWYLNLWNIGENFLRDGIKLLFIKHNDSFDIVKLFVNLVHFVFSNLCKSVQEL